ncbi:MAG: DUF2800 domain-containing protein [Janthinobacterium lividum]
MTAHHARLSPSGASRWMACPGSVALESEYSEDSGSEFASEGTAAHAVAAYQLDPAGMPPPLADMVGKKFNYHDHGALQRVLVTQDMADYLQTYIDAVRARLEEYKLRGAIEVELHVEQKVPIDHITGEQDATGTADVVIIAVWPDYTATVDTWDLKYGKGVVVSAQENEQGQMYALGVIEKFGLAYDFTQVRITIHQPRIDPRPSEWELSVDQLSAFGERAKVAATHAMSVLAFERKEDIQQHLAPSEKACRFCKAKGACPTLRDQVLAAVADDFVDLNKGQVPIAIADAEKILARAYGVEPKGIDFEMANGAARFVVKKPSLVPQLDGAEARLATSDDEHLATCMDAVELVEGWCKGVRAEVERRLLAGKFTDNRYKLVQGKQGNRAWVDEEETEKLFKSFKLKIDQMYDFKLISPTTAEKVLKATNPRRWTKTEALITRASGKPSVAPVSDTRPALVKTPAIDDFEVINGAPEQEAPAETPAPPQPNAAWPFPGNPQPGSPAAEYNATLDGADLV